MSTAAQHHIDCEWHHDQYEAECTCGAAGVDAARVDVMQKLRMARDEIDQMREALELIHEIGVIHGAEWCAEHARKTLKIGR